MKKLLLLVILFLYCSNPTEPDKYADVVGYYTPPLFYEISWGGYTMLKYNGKEWRDDFGKGIKAEFEFLHIKLEKDRIAIVEVNLQNAFGVVGKSKSKTLTLKEGRNEIVIKD